jgi:hypothetical protein
LTSLVLLLFVLVISFINFFDFISYPLYAAAELSSNQVLSQNHYNDNDNRNNENYNYYISVPHATLSAKTNAVMAGYKLPAMAAPPQKSSSLSPITVQTANNNNNNTTAPTATATSMVIDSDGDGLSDILETGTFRTNINRSDSDKDQLPDGKEVNGWLWLVEEQRGCINATLTIGCHVHKTNPLSPDTDGDRNSDYYEYNTFGSNPTDPDQDKDGLSDGIESGPNGLYDTSFFTADTDKDGLSDGLEIQTGRDPTKPDNPSRDRGKAEEPGVNDAPIANPQRVVTVRNDPVDITLTGSDKESKTLYFFLAARPLHGTLSTLMVTGSASAKLTYTPLPNYAGEDSFKFWAYDGKAYSSSPGRVTIYISP